VLPLVSSELLHIPKVRGGKLRLDISVKDIHAVLETACMHDLVVGCQICSLYFDLVSFMVELYPHRVAMLPSHLFGGLMRSLEYGIDQPDASVAVACLGAIGAPHPIQPHQTFSYGHCRCHGHASSCRNG
jgi:hypothetical protein